MIQGGPGRCSGRGKPCGDRGDPRECVLTRGRLVVCGCLGDDLSTAARSGVWERRLPRRCSARGYQEGWATEVAWPTDAWAPGCWSHASLLCSGQDSSVPPSVSSLFLVFDLTFAWWPSCCPFSEPQTFAETPPHTGSGLGYPGDKDTSCPLTGEAQQTDHPNSRRSAPWQSPPLCLFLVEGSRKAHK